jgi:hypothetical protein
MSNGSDSFREISCEQNGLEQVLGELYVFRSIPAQSGPHRLRVRTAKHVLFPSPSWAERSEQAPAGTGKRRQRRCFAQDRCPAQERAWARLPASWPGPRPLPVGLNPQTTRDLVGICIRPNHEVGAGLDLFLHPPRRHSQQARCKWSDRGNSVSDRGPNSSPG